MGRPPIPIDEDQVFKLARKLWTNVAIAQFFDIHPDTLTQRFSGILAKGRSEGKMSINDAQLHVGLVKKNVTMLIWLGKQHLKQSDKQEVEQTITETKRLVIDMGDSTPEPPPAPVTHDVE